MNDESASPKGHRLFAAIQALRIPPSQIARRYPCTVVFVRQVLRYGVTCPARMDALLQEMVLEYRQRHADALEATKGAVRQ